MKKFKVIITVVLVSALFVSLYNLSHKDLDVVGTKTYAVSQGDTLWGIAKEQVDNTVDIRDYIGLIKKYNKNLSPALEVGQEVILPIVK